MDELVMNEHGCFTIKEHGEYLVELVSMIKPNTRLVLTPKDNVVGYDYGWCYNNGVYALLAANVWDLDTEDEPMGWIKRATPGQPRRAPNRLPGMFHRCVHGVWDSKQCEHCSHRHG